MIVAKIRVDFACANAMWANPITSGMVGAEVEIEYTGPEWDGLTKTVVFAGAVVKDVVSNDTVIRIPAECLAVPNALLKVGVYGIAADKTIAIPTLWAPIGRVLRGTDPSGDESTSPTLPVWAEILEKANTAEKIAQDLRKDAEDGRFNGMPGADGHTPEKGVDYFTPAEVAEIEAGAAAKLEPELRKIKDDISDMRFGDPYYGVDLTEKFAGEISGYSDPGAWIRARIRANNFDGIHVNDYIPFTTTNGLKFKARVAGIDPYYDYGVSAIGHHIDFVCEELWPTLKPINPVNYNNGLIPTENVTSDGTATQYVLTKPMYGVANVTLSGTDLTGWTYDKDTYTLTFSTAPAAGTMVVTGTGSKHPWLASDAYLYVNSLAGHVANGTGVNPEIKRVDYTNDGIYHYLPDWLKAVIIEKRFLLNERYSTSGVLSNENGCSWVNLGKLWFPTEVEVYGFPVWGSKGGYGPSGSIQYPLFMGNMRRLKKLNGSRKSWWLLSPDTNKTDWCAVAHTGSAFDIHASHTGITEPVCFRIG